MGELELSPAHIIPVLLHDLQISFGISVVLAYFLVFKTRVQALNAALGNSRRAMMLFPEEVATAVPAVQHAIRSYVRMNLKGAM